MKPLLTSKAVSALLNISRSTLSRMVRSKAIPYVLVSSGVKKLNVRFREEDLEQWVNRRSTHRGLSSLNSSSKA
jgi:excisionase family DNA binding protein